MPANIMLPLLDLVHYMNNRLIWAMIFAWAAGLAWAWAVTGD